jgi:hypothetical protein
MDARRSHQLIESDRQIPNARICPWRPLSVSMNLHCEDQLRLDVDARAEQRSLNEEAAGGGGRRARTVR